MIEAVKSRLADDWILQEILTGGVYRTQEISRQTTPDAFDSHKELLPCALVKQESITPWGPYDYGARLFLRIFLYDQRGYDQIDLARKRIFRLLHKQRATPESRGEYCWQIAHANDLLDMEDPALGVAMGICRFVATIHRSYLEEFVFDAVEWHWEPGDERNSQVLENDF